MSAGTVYTELDLDFSKFEKNQQKLLQSATSASLSIEKNFQNLGVKSDAIYDAMRMSATNSLEMIMAKSTSTGNEIVRAQKAAADKITQINEQQFGKHNSLIDSIKANYIAMAGAAMATYAAVIKPIEAYMENESAILKMGMAMKNQGDFTRASLADMVEYSEQIQRTTSYSHDAALAVMGNLKSYGLSNEQVKLATIAALDLATAKANEGMTTERASEILGKAYLGIATGLKKVGIQIDETAPKGELFNAVLMQVEQRFGGSAQAELLTYAGQWKQLKNQWQDVQEFLGLVFLKTIEAISVAFGTIGVVFWRVAEGIVGSLKLLLQPMEQLAKWAGFDALASGLGSIREGLGAVEQNFRDAAEAAIGSTKANAENFVSFDKVSVAIENMGKTGEKTRAIDEEGNKKWLEFSKQVTLEMAKANDKYWGEFQTHYETGYALAKGHKEREVLLNQWAAAESSKILEKIELAELKAAEHILSEKKNDADAEIALILNRVRQKQIEGQSEIQIAAFTSSETTRLAREDFANRIKLDDDRLKHIREISQKEQITNMEMISAKEIAGKTGLDREIAEAEAAAGKKILAAKFEYDEGKKNLSTYLNIITSANLEKDLKIMDATKKNAEERWKIEKSMSEDIAKFTKDEYDLKMKLLNDEFNTRKILMGEDQVGLELLLKWKKIKETENYEERALRQGKFWDDTKALYDKDIGNQTTWSDSAAKIWDDLFKSGGTISKDADAFWGGMQVAYNQDIRNQTTWGEQGAQIWRETFKAIEKTTETFFVDLLHGQLKTAEDYFNAFKDAVIAAIAQMIAKWVAFTAMTAAGNWLFGSPTAFIGGGGAGVGGTLFNTGVSAGANAGANYLTGGTGGVAGAISSWLGGGTAAGTSVGGAAAGGGMGGAFIGGGAAGAGAGTGAMTAGQIGAMYGTGASFGAGAGATAAGAGTFGTGFSFVGAAGPLAGIGAFLAAWYFGMSAIASHAPMLISNTSSK